MGDVVNRIHVAVPKARDGVARPPVIPPGVAAARARRDAGEKRRTEKDLQVRRGVGCALSCVCFLAPSRQAWVPCRVPYILAHLVCPSHQPPRPQEEQGGAGVYNSDVRKLYDLKDPAWRYDIMPEIMNGKNVSVRE